MIIKYYDKSKFISNNPTLIGVVAGIKLYGHPTYGDEYPLIAIDGNQCGITDFWELPLIEALDFINIRKGN